MTGSLIALQNRRTSICNFKTQASNRVFLDYKSHLQENKTGSQFSSVKRILPLAALLTESGLGERAVVLSELRASAMRSWYFQRRRAR